MSNPIVNLNVRANTARAMADFKKFSDSLNNKFLVSGLKVDLITSTLKQINSEFQKSIGEQGLLGASSIRAAQNQAALLTSTFKGFGLEASKSINANMTKALSDVAVKAGGTMADIKKTMGAVPFISANLSSEERTNLAKQMLSFQRDLRRSGVSEEGATIGQKFLSGQTNVQDMINSQDPITAKMGMTLANKGAQLGTIFNAQMRTEYLRELMNDPELKSFLAEQAKQTSGFKLYIEDLNTKLFNPESGLFGALRKVKMSATRTTTIFDETDRIIKSVFGPQGIFIKFFQKIAASFNINEPLKFIIMGMDFLGRQISALSSFIDSPKFQEITGFVKKIFDNTWNVFKNIYDQIVGGGFDSTQITKDIKDTGTGIRQFIRNIGSTIRGENIDKETGFGTSIISTLAEETGKTVVTLIQEIFKVFIDKAPGIAAKALPAMSKAFNNVMTQMFGGLAEPIKMLMNFIPGPVGMLARTANMTSKVGADNPWSLAAVGAAAFAPSLIGLGKRGAGVFRGGIRANRRYIDRKLSTGPNRWRGGPGGPGGPGDTGPRITQTLRGDNGEVLQYGSILERPVPPTITPPGRPGFWGRLRGRNRPPGFMDRVRRSREFKSLHNERLKKWGNLPGYSHEIGPIPDLGIGNGKPWVNDFYGGYDPDKEELPILGSLDDKGNDKGYGGESSISDINWAMGEKRQERISRIRELRRQGKFGRGMKKFGRFMGKNKGKLLAGGLMAGVAMSLLSGNPGKTAGLPGAPNENMENMAAGSGGIGNLLGGASNGAMMGMAFGPWGALIGGVLGAGSSLLDKGTREGIGKFVKGFGNMVLDWVEGIGSAFNRSVASIGSGITGVLTGFVNSIKTGFESLPIVSLFKSLSGSQSQSPSSSSSSSWIDWIKEKMGIHYHGLNDSGSALAMEARMSGNRSFLTGGGNVANSGEIIIPSGGMGRLVDALETKIANRSSGGGGVPMVIKLDININNPVMLGDNRELIDSLREPVLNIVNDAYKSVANNRVRSTTIS